MTFCAVETHGRASLYCIKTQVKTHRRASLQRHILPSNLELMGLDQEERIF